MTFKVLNIDGTEPDLNRIETTQWWAKGLINCDLWAIDEDGDLILLDRCGNYIYPPSNQFQVIWNAAT